MVTQRWLMLSVLVLAFPSEAMADSEAEAEQLFRDGKRLMDEQRFAEACSAFEVSHKLDAAITTLVNLANCREKNQELATAWVLFLDVERQTRGDGRLAALGKTAKERAVAIEGRLSFVTVSVADASVVNGLEILRNNAVLAPELWNRAIPTDGGTYEFTARAPGMNPWSTTIAVQPESAKVSVDVPALRKAPSKSRATRPSGNAEVGRRIQAPSASARFTTPRKVAVAVGIVGAIALGGAAVLGVQAKGFEDDAFALCDATTCNMADEANRLLDNARSRSLLANVGLGIGSLAVLGAAVLWMTGAEAGNASSDGSSLSLLISSDGVGGTVAMRF